MAIEQNLPDVNQKITIDFSTKVDESLSKYLKGIQRQLAQMQKQFKAFTANQKESAQTWTQISKSIDRAADSMTNHVKGLNQARRATDGLSRASSGLFRQLRNIGSLIGVGGAGGLAYALVKRLRDNISSEFDLAISGGAGQIAQLRKVTGGKNMLQAMQLAAGFQSQSAFNRFGLGSQSFKGLIGAQSALYKGVPDFDKVNSILLGVTKDLEPQRLRSFLKTSESDPELALLRSATSGNIGDVTSALNVLELGKLGDKGQLPPELKAAQETSKAMTDLTAAVDKLSLELLKDLLPAITKTSEIISSLAGGASGMSAGQLIGGAAGAYGAYRIGKWGLGKGISALWNWGKGAVPFGAGGAPSPGGGPIPVSVRRVMPSPKGLPFYPSPSAPGLPGGAYPLAPYAAPAAGLSPWLGLIPLSMAIGGGLAGRSINKDTIRNLERAQDSNSQSRLGQMGFDQSQSAKTELERLKAQRLRLVGVIGQNPMATDTDRKNLVILQDHLRSINAEIERLTPSKTVNQMASKFWDTIKTGAAYAKQGIDKAAASMSALEKKMLQNHLKQLQRNAARRQELELSATEAESFADVARLQYAVATAGPLGVLGGIDQMGDYLKALNEQKESLEKLRATLDESTATGRIEGNKYRAQILQLTLESKQAQREFQQMTLDSVVANAMNASGAFTKILVSREMNLGAGLERNIVKEFDSYTGSVRRDHISREPIYPQELLRGMGQSNPLRAIDVATGQNKLQQMTNIARGFQQLIAMEEKEQDENAGHPVQEHRQTRTGGRTTLGPPGS